MSTANKAGSDLVQRDARGRLQPGSTLNKAGRKPGAATLAERTRWLTEPDELVKFHLGVMASAKEKTCDRLQAAAWLADRGWGRAPQMAELVLHRGEEADEPQLNYASLSVDELRLYLTLNEKLLAQGDGSDTRALVGESESDSQSSTTNAVDCTTEGDRAAG